MKYKKCSICGKWLPVIMFATKKGMCRICNRDYDWKRRYGISPDEYFKLYNQQQGKCAICGQEFPYLLHVDHDHETGKVRGLLCMGCNVKLEAVSEHINTIEKYLKDSK